MGIHFIVINFYVGFNFFLINCWEESQEEIANSEYNASTGGGAVNVTVSGDKKVKSIKIDPEAIDEDDIEMLEDMILAAVNQALTMADEASAQSMGEITGGLGLGL